MDERQALAGLCATLADLYDDLGSLRRIVHDAGLDRAQIAFSSRAEDSWHSILLEAKKHGRLEQIVQIALREYSGNRDLQAAWESYKNVGKDNKTNSIPPVLQDNQTRLTQIEGQDKETEITPTTNKKIYSELDMPIIYLIFIAVLAATSPFYSPFFKRAMTFGEQLGRQFGEQLLGISTATIEPTPTPQATPVPTVTLAPIPTVTLTPLIEALCRVTVENTEVRSGPDTVSEILANLAVDEELIPLEVYFSPSTDELSGAWVMMMDINHRPIGWIYEANLDCNIALDDLPETTPTPEPAAIPTSQP